MAHNSKVFTSPQHFTHKGRAFRGASKDQTGQLSGLKHRGFQEPQFNTRCRAGNEKQNNQFDQFLQWGASLLRRTLVNDNAGERSRPSSASRRQPRAETLPEEEETPAAESGEASTSAALREDAGEGGGGGLGWEEPEEVGPNPDGLDERREQFKHLVAVGAEISHDWPPEGTPTWGHWLTGMHQTEEAELLIGDLKQQLDDAVAIENYQSAAAINAQLQDLLAEDEIANMYKEYEAAIASEDYSRAARVFEEGHLGLPGWWKVADSNAKNPDHLLCVIPAFDRMVFKTYTPADLASLYGATTPPRHPDMVLPKEKIPDPVQPSLETLYSAGRTVAELHFKRIVTHGEGVLGGGTDAQPSEEGSRQSVMCAHVEVDDAQSSTLGDSLVGTTDRAVVLAGATVSVDGGPEISLEEFLLKTQPTSSKPSTSEEERKQMEEIKKGLEAEDKRKEAENFRKKFAETAELKKKLEASIRTALDLKRALDPATTSSVTKNKDGTYNTLPEIRRMVRLPTQLTRFGRDNNRMMLRIPEPPRAEGEAAPKDYMRSAEELLDGAEIVPLKFEGGDAPSTKDILDRLQDVLKARSPEDGSSGPAKVGVVLDMQPGNAQSNAETLGKMLKGGGEGGAAADSSELLKLVAEALARSESAPRNLTGTISYKRLHLDDSTTDPFTGLFAAHFPAHGFEILSLQRSIGEDNETYVEATKVTGDGNVPAGSVAFKVPIGAKHVNLGGMSFGSGTAMVDVYKGQGRVARANYVDARWVDGILLHFKTPNAFTKGAHLGFHYMLSQQKQSQVLLSRLPLDDLSVRQPIPLGCSRAM